MNAVAMYIPIYKYFREFLGGDLLTLYSNYSWGGKNQGKGALKPTIGTPHNDSAFVLTVFKEKKNKIKKCLSFVRKLRAC